MNLITTIDVELSFNMIMSLLRLELGHKVAARDKAAGNAELLLMFKALLMSDQCHIRIYF